MNIAAVHERIAAIEAAGSIIGRGSGATVEAIAELEAALGRSLPAAYGELLRAFGWLSRGDNFLSGITNERNLRDGGGSVLFDTEMMRKTDDLPDHLIVVQKHEDGVYCLDLNSDDGNGCAVVNFERGWNAGKAVARTLEEWLFGFFLYVKGKS